FMARRTRAALGHPRREWFGENVAAQRADRLPYAVGRRNQRARPALWRDRLARAAQTDRPGQLVRATNDVRVRAGASGDCQWQIRDDRLLGTRYAFGSRTGFAHSETNRVRTP